MSTIGRNSPCPCGSGKKYKQCCGATGPVRPRDAYERLRQTDGEASLLMELLFERQCGEDAVNDAWTDFYFGQAILFAETDPEYEFFVRWMQFDWLPDAHPGPAEMLLEDTDPRIDSNIRRLVESTLQAPYSFLQVVNVEPGVSMTARDILRKTEIRIQERKASQTLLKGHILYARVVEIDGTHIMMGNGSRIIPAAYLADLLDFREGVLQDEPSSGGALPGDLLLDLEEDLRVLYFQLINTATTRSREIRNSDGDPLLFHTVRYDVTSFDRAFHSLKALEQNVNQTTDEQLINAGKRKSTAGDREAVIHWLKKQKGRGKQEASVLAVLTITDTRLVAEANSAKRALRVQKEIEKRLGKDAVYIGTEILSPEGAIGKTRRRAGDKPVRERLDQERLLRESPEIQLIMKEMMEKHWASWPDVPLPVLRGMTPRQAARDPLGRELLESVLLDFESRGGEPGDGPTRIDTANLRRELGM